MHRLPNIRSLLILGRLCNTCVLCTRPLSHSQRPSGPEPVTTSLLISKGSYREDRSRGSAIGATDMADHEIQDSRRFFRTLGCIQYNREWGYWDIFYCKCKPFINPLVFSPFYFTCALFNCHLLLYFFFNMIFGLLIIRYTTNLFKTNLF